MSGTLSKAKVILTIGVLLIAAGSITFLLAVNLSSLIIAVPHQLGVSHQLAWQEYQRLLLYLQVPGMQLPHLGVFALSRSAMQHFATVKGYVLLSEAVAVVSTIITFRWLREEKRRQQLWQLLAPLEYLITFLVISFTLGLVNFTNFFIKSHYLLFKNMNWILSPAKDPVILLMPISFFSHVFVMWGLGLLFFLVIIWVSIWYRSCFMQF